MCRAYETIHVCKGWLFAWLVCKIACCSIGSKDSKIDVVKQHHALSRSRHLLSLLQDTNPLIETSMFYIAALFLAMHSTFFALSFKPRCCISIFMPQQEVTGLSASLKIQLYLLLHHNTINQAISKAVGPGCCW